MLALNSQSGSEVLVLKACTTTDRPLALLLSALLSSEFASCVVVILGSWRVKQLPPITTPNPGNGTSSGRIITNNNKQKSTCKCISRGFQGRSGDAASTSPAVAHPAASHLHQREGLLVFMATEELGRQRIGKRHIKALKNSLFFQDAAAFLA